MECWTRVIWGLVFITSLTRIVESKKLGHADVLYQAKLSISRCMYRQWLKHIISFICVLELSARLCLVGSHSIFLQILMVQNIYPRGVYKVLCQICCVSGLRFQLFVGTWKLSFLLPLSITLTLSKWTSSWIYADYHCVSECEIHGSAKESCTGWIMRIALFLLF